MEILLIAFQVFECLSFYVTMIQTDLNWESLYLFAPGVYFSQDMICASILNLLYLGGKEQRKQQCTPDFSPVRHRSHSYMRWKILRDRLIHYRPAAQALLPSSTYSLSFLGGSSILRSVNVLPRQHGPCPDAKNCDNLYRCLLQANDI